MILRYEDDAMLWVMIKVPVPETDTPAKLARLLAATPADETMQATNGLPTHPLPNQSASTFRRR